MDLSNHLSGSYCAILLGDQGADVIKVERPDGGDDARAMPLIGGQRPALCRQRRPRSQQRSVNPAGALPATTVGTLARRRQKGRHPVRRCSEFWRGNGRSPHSCAPDDRRDRPCSAGIFWTLGIAAKLSRTPSELRRRLFSSWRAQPKFFLGQRDAARRAPRTWQAI